MPAMPFEIATRRVFCASHQLRLYDGALEPLHGHNWEVTVAVCAASLDSIGVVMDFHELERMVDTICSPMHNRHLNELPAFARRNPSAENVAAHIGESLRLPTGVALARVDVLESPGCVATYRP
jgi:6-pyruvoyltetrahydropterin/6-carboxytetrahydropterin synthase